MSEEKKRAATYARSATSDQTGDNTLFIQIKECKAYAEKHGYVVSEEHIFSEVYTGAWKWHGSPPMPPQMKLLLQAMREHLVDVLLIREMSRIARNQAAVILFIEEAKNLGVTVISVAENFEATSEAAHFLVQVFHEVAEIEREKIAQRTRHE